MGCAALMMCLHMYSMLRHPQPLHMHKGCVLHYMPRFVTAEFMHAVHAPASWPLSSSMLLAALFLYLCSGSSPPGADVVKPDRPSSR